MGAEASVRAMHVHEVGEELTQLIDALSSDARRRFIQELIEAAVLYETNGDDSRIRRALAALRVSRNLHERPDYQQALQDAEREPIDGPVVDAADFLSRLHEQRTRSRG